MILISPNLLILDEMESDLRSFGHALLATRR